MFRHDTNYSIKIIRKCDHEMLGNYWCGTIVSFKNDLSSFLRKNINADNINVAIYVAVILRLIERVPIATVRKEMQREIANYSRKSIHFWVLVYKISKCSNEVYSHPVLPYSHFYSRIKVQQTKKKITATLFFALYHIFHFKNYIRNDLLCKVIQSTIDLATFWSRDPIFSNLDELKIPLSISI